MAATDLHLVQNYSLSQSDGGNRRSDVELDGAIDARAHMPLALLQHCPSNVHEDQMRMDVVDYSSNAQQVDDDCGGGGGGGGDEDSPAQLCHDPPSIASSSSSGHMHMPMSIKVERDGSPNPEEDARRGLSAFCEALYSGGPPQGFVVNNVAQLGPDAKPMLAIMAQQQQQHHHQQQHQMFPGAGGGGGVVVKKRRKRRKLKPNGELGPGEEHFPYRCDVCEKGLRSLAALKYHERIHSGETPFECRFCGRKFAVTSHLNYHIRVHTGEKPYECGTCGRRFAVSNHLRYHERAHTGEKPFRCSVCAKGFTSNFNLKYHEQIHAGIKPHSCDFCGKKYRSKAGLTGHQMKKGHHERFQSMMRDGYFLDGHGPSFSNGEMKSDQDPSASSAPSPASAGEGPSGLQSQGGKATPKRRGPGRPPTLMSATRQMNMFGPVNLKNDGQMSNNNNNLNPELPPSSSSSSSSSSVVPGRGPPLSRGPPMDMFGPVNLKNDGLLNEVHHLHNAPGLQPTPQPPPASSTPASTSSSSSSSEIVSRSNGDNVGGKEDDDIGVGGGGGGGPGGIGGVGGYMPSPSPMYPMMNIRSAAPMFAPPPQPGFLSYPAQQAYQVQFEQQQRFFMGRSPVPSPGHLGGGHHHPLTHHPLHHHHQPPLHQHHQLQYADRKPDEPQ